MLKMLDKEKITELRTWAFALTIILFLFIFFIKLLYDLQIWSTFKHEFRHIGFVNLLPTNPPLFILLIVIMPVVYFIVNKYSKNETIKNIVIINAVLLPTLLFIEFVIYDAHDLDLNKSSGFFENAMDSALYSEIFKVMAFYLWTLFLMLLIFALLSPIVDNLKTRRKVLVNSLAISFGLIFVLFSNLLSSYIVLSQYALMTDEAEIDCIYKTIKIYPFENYPEIYDECYYRNLIEKLSETELSKKTENMMRAKEYYGLCLLSKLPISEYEMVGYSHGFFSLIMAIICLVLSKSVFKKGRLRNELIGKGAMAASVTFWFVSYIKLSSYLPIYPLGAPLMSLLSLAIWFALYYLIYWLASNSFPEDKKKLDKSK
ncbi:MAG: hypothetical protein QXM75_02430 [Candidatus Diapherotrites archaeon]